jgi:hypothetical protein
MASLLGFGDSHENVFEAKFDRDPLQAIKALKSDFVPRSKDRYEITMTCYDTT